MKIQDLNGKKIALIGYEREGQAMHRTLHTHAPEAQITVCKRTPITLLFPARLVTGDNYLSNLSDFDAIIKSSGIKDLPEFVPVRARMTSMTDIFFDTIANSGVQTIGVTGSKGKSTVTTLIYEALKAHYGERAHLMGNIGIPAIDFLDAAKPGHMFVIELSSFQLEHLTCSPHVAVITSFFPEHLDRHGSVEAYWAAKKPIAKYQHENDVVFYNAGDDKCRELAALSLGKKIPFTANDFPLPITDTKFKGEHNRSNLAAAYSVAQFLGVPAEVALRTLCRTTPLPHRLQALGTRGGIQWVNDSFATAPDATMAGLQALGSQVETLITGGVDRGVDYQPLGELLANMPHIKNIVLFPASGEKIAHYITAAGGAKNLYRTASMDDAVQWAATHTSPGKTCLLSSASASFNVFKDFVARGEAFIKAVENLGS